MSREIKFRAWDKRTNKMFAAGGLMIGHGASGWSYPETEEEEPFLPTEDSNLVIEQFTGFMDRHGKDIYEGDILATENDGKDGADVWGKEILEPVSWDEQNGCWRHGIDFHGETIYSPEYVEVVGNIHQHPELLPSNEGEVK